MKVVTNIAIKSAALPEGIRPPLTPKESQIFDYLRSACNAVPQLSQGKFGVPTLRVAGGWVRDKLMPMVRHDINIKPPKDLDITIDIMDGGEFGKLLGLYDKISGQKAFSFGEARGETANRVGVCFCRIFGEEIEFLQLRKESYGREGDRQSVATEVGSITEDTFRRDLTINSMYYNLGTGLVEDVSGQGFDDLASLTLRTPSRPGFDVNQEVKRIYTEDPVRVLRILRFFSRWPNAKIAPETLNGMMDPQVQQLLVQKIWNPNIDKEAAGVPPEKTAEELRKIMVGKQPQESVSLMLQTGLLQKILGLPKNFHPLNMDQRNRHHQLDVIEHTMEVLKNVNTLSSEFNLSDEDRMKMNFAALWHDIGKLDPRSHSAKPDGNVGYSGDPNNPNSVTHQQSSADQWEIFANAMKMSDDEKTGIHDLVLNHMNPHSHIEEPVSDKVLRRYMRKNPSWIFQYIHAMADAMSKSKEPGPDVGLSYRNNMDRLHGLSSNLYQNMGKSNDLLNGKDIIQIVGMPAKPPPGQIGYIEVVKERIREAQDENPALTREEAISIVQNMLQSGELDMYRNTR